jgi:hypothetical protein
MTKKDYIVIAETLNKLVKGLEQQFSRHHLGVVRELVNKLSDEFQEDNPQFDRKIFWKACGL